MQARERHQQGTLTRELRQKLRLAHDEIRKARGPPRGPEQRTPPSDSMVQRLWEKLVSPSREEKRACSGRDSTCCQHEISCRRALDQPKLGFAAQNQNFLPSFRLNPSVSVQPEVEGLPRQVWRVVPVGGEQLVVCRRSGRGHPAAWNVDHIFPWSLGGEDAEANLQLLPEALNCMAKRDRCGWAWQQSSG